MIEVGGIDGKPAEFAWRFEEEKGERAVVVCTNSPDPVRASGYRDLHLVISESRGSDFNLAVDPASTINF